MLMTDVFTKDVRSKIMSSIHGRNTSPEITLRKKMFERGFRYRIDYKMPHSRRIDIALVSRKLAVFVDGCFWHRCPTCFKKPKSNTSYWKPKITSNVRRDADTNKILESLGWKIIRFWEHEIKDDLEKCITIIEKRY